ncbi:MAG: prepilin-type N-terminal cleavage/methylation domain-containing protein [Candidatus Omnitrophota bacterium]
MWRINRKGFTLVEIMIVVAIIALLAAIAIPNLLRARINANHTAATSALKSINTAAQSFNGANPARGYPASLAELTGTAATAPAGPPYVDPTVDTTTTGRSRQGYNFTYTITEGAGTSADPGLRFTVYATPATANVTGVNTYFCDESGVLYYSTTAQANPGEQAASGTDPDGAGVDWLQAE